MFKRTRQGEDGVILGKDHKENRSCICFVERRRKNWKEKRRENLMAQF
jgi:hypothetical protein